MRDIHLPILKWLTVVLITVTSMTNAFADKLDRELLKKLPTLTGKEQLDAYGRVVNDGEWVLPTDSLITLCDDWIEVAVREANQKQEAEARLKKLTLLYNSENWPELIAEATIQRQWMESHQQWNGFYKAWRDIAEGYSYSHRPQTALREAEQMQDHAQKRDNKLGRALAYQQMGIIYNNIDHREAVKAFLNTISLLNDVPEAKGNEKLSAYYYLCQELDQLGDYKQELEWCKAWKQELDDVNEIQKKKHNGNNMDVHYLEYYLWHASALINLKMLSEADEDLTLCEELNKSIADPYLEYQINVHRTHLEMERGDYKKALQYSERYVKIMEEDRWPTAQCMRGAALMNAGRYKEAALLYANMYSQKDSIFTRDMRMQLDEFNKLFELDELKMKSRLERSQLIISIIAVVLIAMLIIFYFRHKAAVRLKKTNKKLEESNAQLQIARARAEESSRMKTDFIQQISHEIRTPLNILSGFAQVITTPDMVLDDETKKDINHRITENTERITSLVNKMLELSEANSHTVIEQDDNVLMVEIAAQAAEESGINRAEHVTFSLNVDAAAEQVQIHTNMRYASRALSLLIDNAQKFTKQGTVTLRVTPTAFIVEDTGIGVPPSEAEHIFEEFVQLDEYYDGTGIGLSVARNIARRLGGDIHLDTSYTGGARFVFSMP